MSHIDPTRPVDDGSGLSAAPGTPQTQAKAIWGAVSAALLSFLTALLPFLTDDKTLGDVTTNGWVVAIIAALATGGITGGVVRQVQNKPL